MDSANTSSEPTKAVDFERRPCDERLMHLEWLLQEQGIFVPAPAFPSLETVCRLADEHAALTKTNQELRLEVQQKNQIIDELQAKLEAQEKAGKRQAQPFRRDTLKEPGTHKSPGRVPGQGAFLQRPRPEPEQIDPGNDHYVPLPECPHCGNQELEIKVFENVQIDLPKITPLYTRFVTEGSFCKECGEWVQSRHPEQMSLAMGCANLTLGPRLLAVAADMHEYLGASYHKIQDLLANVMNLSLSRSTLYNAVNRLVQRAEPVYDELLEIIRQCAVVHADETGWRIGTANAWLWVFCNTEYSVFTIRSGEGARGHQVVLDVLGESFSGTLVSDGLAAYDKEGTMDAFIKQKCLGHLLRAFKDLRDTSQTIEMSFASETIGILKQAIILKRQATHLSSEGYAAACAAIEKTFDGLIEDYASLQSHDATRLRNRLTKQRPHLFTFLYKEAVEPTNNCAEQGIRGVGVITRKTQGCNRTSQGARRHAILSSISATLRKQERSVIPFMETLATPSMTRPSIRSPNTS